MFDCITVGSATRDVFLESSAFRVNRNPQFVSGWEMAVPLGSKIEVDRIVFETGGGATNTAMTFARLGLKTAFIGKIGSRDARGREILEKLAAEGVDVSLVSRDSRLATAYSVLLMTSKGERTALVYRGASSRLSVGDIPWLKLRSRWLYITSLSGNVSLMRRLLDVCTRRSIKVAWNPGATELAWGMGKLVPLLRQVTVLFLNREEASALTRIPYTKDTKIFESLCLHLPGLVVVTEGSKGASVCDNQRKYLSIPHPVKILNTTGAGDAFGSGFVAGLLLRRGDVRFALQLGTANAESVIQGFGAKEGLLRRIPPRRKLCRVRVIRFPNP